MEQRYPKQSKTTIFKAHLRVVLTHNNEAKPKQWIQKFCKALTETEEGTEIEIKFLNRKL
jgi:anion-transporting  ArsA/GET3 family ATPase